MCGRFFLDTRAGDIIEHYNAPPPDLFTARYNIAPTTPVLGFANARFDLFRWGLIPAWAKDISLGNRMFNARAETVAEKPSFRNAYRSPLSGASQRLLRMAQRERAQATLLLPHRPASVFDGGYLGALAGRRRQ